MNVLLDTQVVLWWLADDAKLTDTHRSIIADTSNVCSISAASIWEISIKSALGKLQVPKFYEDTLREQGFIELEITWKHGKAVQELPLIHRDPFDRLLVAQAIVEGFGLLSVDERIREYAVEVL